MFFCFLSSFLYTTHLFSVLLHHCLPVPELLTPAIPLLLVCLLSSLEKMSAITVPPHRLITIFLVEVLDTMQPSTASVVLSL